MTAPDRQGKLGRKGVSRKWAVRLGLIILLVLGIVAGGYFFLWQQAKVGMITVRRGTLVKAFYATGTVRPDNEYVVKAEVQGALVELLARENQKVEKGQMMARVDDRQLRFAAERAKAELEEAEAQAAEESPSRKEIVAKLTEARSQLQIADSQLKRFQAAAEKNAAALTDVENAQRTFVLWFNAVAGLESQLGTWGIDAKKKVAVAQANLRRAQADVADADVRAPISGVVLERYVELNEVVQVNQRLFLVADPEDKIMKAAVDEEDVTSTRLGQVVYMQLYAFSQPQVKPFTGEVFDILPTADPRNKTFLVKVRFVKPPKQLRVGMTAELNFIEEERANALIIPSTALLDGKVYRPARGGYEPVEVKTGIRSLEQVEIVEGLKEGEAIVADAKQVAEVRLPAAKKLVVPTRKGDVE